MSDEGSALKTTLKPVKVVRRTIEEKILQQQMNKVRQGKSNKTKKQEDIMADDTVMNKLVKELEDQFEDFLDDMSKKKGFISAHVRARKTTLYMEKLFKDFRKASIEFDKAYKAEKKGE